MAGKNQAALAVCTQTKVIFPFKSKTLIIFISIKTRLSHRPSVRQLTHPYIFVGYEMTKKGTE